MNEKSAPVPAPPKLTDTLPRITVQSLSPVQGAAPVVPPVTPTSVRAAHTVSADDAPAAAAGTPGGGEPLSVVVALHSGPQGIPVPASTPPKKGLLRSVLPKVGAGSLMLSLLIHAGILAVAALMVTTIVTGDKAVDFLPGGGSKAGQEASQQLAHQVQVKKRSLMNKSTPMQKIVSTSTNAAIALQDMPVDTLDMPELSSVMGGGMMGSAGFGSGGAGGGFGDGMGLGGMSGTTFKPIIMFGQDLKARRIAVIMDVSGSMTPHLTKVIKELDRVASGSRVVLYVGCGVASPEKGKRLDDDAIPTRSSSKDEERSFELFWRKSHQKPAPATAPAMVEPDKKKKKAEKDPVPEEDVYRVLAGRGETYFIKNQGIKYAWISLLVRELRDADALYWFSDFQDEVDDEQMEAVLKNLKRRKQKLFIHASGKGRSFEQIRDKIAIPSGGMVVEDPKKESKKE